MGGQKKNAEQIVDQAAQALRGGTVPKGPPAQVVEKVIAAGSLLTVRGKRTLTRGRFNMNRLAKIAASILIAAAIVAGIVFLTRKSGPATVPPDSVAEDLFRSRTARRLSLEERVDRADLIIRGTIRAIEQTAQGLTFQYNVTKVLSGTADTDVISISPLSDETIENNNDWIGRDVIVFLSKSVGTDGQPAYLLLGVNVCALDESLDDDEAHILEIVSRTK